MQKVMARVTAIYAAMIVALAWPGALDAHHSLARFDTTTPVWVKGTVIRFDRISPHARILVEQKDGSETRRWFVDGPSANQFARMGIGEDFLKVGDVVEVCGFPQKAEFQAQSEGAVGSNPNAATQGRPFSGHLLVMPNGKRQFWSDYGVLDKCLRPGESAQQLRDEAFGRR